MDTTFLDHLMRQLDNARDAVNGELLRVFPVGTCVSFKIMDSQRRPSTGKVVGSGWRSGYLRVLHHQAKERSRYRYRDVYYKDIEP